MINVKNKNFSVVLNKVKTKSWKTIINIFNMYKSVLICALLLTAYAGHVRKSQGTVH